MTRVNVRGLWKGTPLSETVELELQNELSNQQKQVTALALSSVTSDAGARAQTSSDIHESAVDFAMRLGFTKLDYYYEAGGREIVVDIMDPSRAV